MEDTLLYKLKELAESDMYPFHMPGHKRHMLVDELFASYQIDITEIDDFDNLHYAQDILKREQERIGKIYGSKQSFLLVNGSSCGVLAAISSVTNSGDSILLARNSHKSAYHAIYLQQLKTGYLQPMKVNDFCPYGGIRPEDVKIGMEQTGAKVVFITSPTYEGIVSDVETIAKIVHDRNGILIVDEAHGAHLAFHSSFPQSSIACGADLVVQSLHKTMPSMTQTALLHACSNRVDIEKLKRYLTIFQTSSPSYVLMASVSECMTFIENQGKEAFEIYWKRLNDFYEKAKKLIHLQVLDDRWTKDTYQLTKDPSKIVIYLKQATDATGKAIHGPWLYDILRNRYHLQMEMQMGEYVLAMTSVMDTQEGFDRLIAALFEIDKQLDNKEKGSQKGVATDEKQSWHAPKIKTSIYAAMNALHEQLPLEMAQDRVSYEYLYLYPPGTPILVPGEVITKEILQDIQQLKDRGLSLQGTKDETGKTICVLL